MKYLFRLLLYNISEGYSMKYIITLLLRLLKNLGGYSPYNKDKLLKSYGYG